MDLCQLADYYVYNCGKSMTEIEAARVNGSNMALSLAALESGLARLGIS